MKIAYYHHFLSPPCIAARWWLILVMLLFTPPQSEDDARVSAASYQCSAKDTIVIVWHFSILNLTHNTIKKVNTVDTRRCHYHSHDIAFRQDKNSRLEPQQLSIGIFSIRMAASYDDGRGHAEMRAYIYKATLHSYSWRSFPTACFVLSPLAFILSTIFASLLIIFTPVASTQQLFMLDSRMMRRISFHFWLTIWHDLLYWDRRTTYRAIALLLCCIIDRLRPAITLASRQTKGMLAAYQLNAWPPRFWYCTPGCAVLSFISSPSTWYDLHDVCMRYADCRIRITHDISYL